MISKTLVLTPHRLVYEVLEEEKVIKILSMWGIMNSKIVGNVLLLSII